MSVAVIGVALLGPAYASSLPQTMMQNEDSHPHEVKPGKTGRFFIDPVRTAHRLDVKCTLGGPVGPVRLVFAGVAPEKWAKDHPVFTIGAAELHIDIEGVVSPQNESPYFDFINLDGQRLLWHQCYNN